MGCGVSVPPRTRAALTPAFPPSTWPSSSLTAAWSRSSAKPTFTGETPAPAHTHTGASSTHIASPGPTGRPAGLPATGSQASSWPFSGGCLFFQRSRNVPFPPIVRRAHLGQQRTWLAVVQVAEPHFGLSSGHRTPAPAAHTRGGGCPRGHARPARPCLGTRLLSLSLMGWHFGTHLSLVRSSPPTHCPGLPVQSSSVPTPVPGPDNAVPAPPSLTSAVSKEHPVGSVQPVPFRWPVSTLPGTGQGHAAPTGRICGVGVRRGEDRFVPCVPSPGRVVTATLPAAVFTPSPLLQGYQDHRLLALQFAPELVPVLLGVDLSGHRLHSLGLRWRGKQVSHSLPRGAVTQAQGHLHGSPTAARCGGLLDPKEPAT